MSKKLSIVVTHYNEKWEVCKPLFDSIALQQAVPFEEIETIIVQDGEEGLSEIVGKIDNFPCDLFTVAQPHGGISKARNFGIDKAQGEYISFCDCDDMYVSVYGLHLVFSAMQDQPDVIINNFVEETHDTEGKFRLARHENDATFVHGKAYKRQFLIDNNIRFDESLYLHEDGYFNNIAVTIAETKKTIETPYYVWKWNDNSTVRREKEDFVLKTYPELMKVRTAVAREFDRRECVNEYIDCVIKTVLDSYYDFNKEPYLKEENKHYVNKAKHAFKKFYEEFEQTYKEAAVKRKADIAMNSKFNAYKNGLIMESFTISEFLDEIKNKVK